MSSEWWKRSVIYQVYPRSFADSNGDGIGDLAGITGKLEYLAWLGIDAVWISPFYPPPMVDFGYDVSDYYDVDPIFSTLSDFDVLLEKAHSLGIRILIDYIPNHTSSRHPWFLESRTCRTNSKRDWYLWRDPAPRGGPPTNWQSRFGGGPAWTFDELTGQYYMHSFLPEQPDLNWRNPEVQHAMCDVLRFWLDRGVDGFRVDVCDRLVKDSQFRNNPPNPHWKPGMDPARKLLQPYSKNRPENMEINRLFRRVVDQYDDRVLVGESYLPLPELMTYYGDGDQYHLPFNFSLIGAELLARALQEIIESYEGHLPKGAWPNWVWGNHDRSRLASRVGGHGARLAMFPLLTLRGTPTIYYGDELGMVDGKIPPDRVVDPWGIVSPEFGRDPARTPMLWDDSPHAGFCPPSTTPWLPINGNYRDQNAAALRGDPHSILFMTRALSQFRRQSSALTVGNYRTVECDEALLVFERRSDNERYLVAANFGPEPVAMPKYLGAIVFRTAHNADQSESSTLAVGVMEGVILKVELNKDNSW